MPDHESTPEADAGLVKLDDEREVMDVLTRLRPVERKAYRVTIFGSARVDPGHWVYQAVRDLGAELTRLGCDIVEWARRFMLRPDAPLASPEDMAIPRCVPDGAGILQIIREHHALWKSRQSPAR